MSPEDQKYFEDLLDMFLTPGWKEFIRDFEESTAALDQVAGIADVKALYTRQGQLLTLNHVIGYESSIRRAMDDDDEAV